MMETIENDASLQAQLVGCSTHLKNLLECRILNGRLSKENFGTGQPVTLVKAALYAVDRGEADIADEASRFLER